MKVSYKWLKDYVDIRIDPRKLADLLTMSGSNVAAIEKLGGDHVFDLEITSNRADCLSILGIAREVAALLGKSLKIPPELREKKQTKALAKKSEGLKILVKDPDLCPRYTGRIIRDIEVGPSPEWLKERILSSGLRPVNNIVDITNFVLLETGQPMHAFDLDRIQGPVVVRRAEKGEKIITIDNVQRTCDAGTLVIADDSGLIAIAGLMGGLSTEVNDMTHNILLESACFNSISVRKTSRFLGLGSESSYRFERKIDESMVGRASERAKRLISEIAGGQSGSLSDVWKKKPSTKTIAFNPDRVNSLLGASFDKKKSLKILKALGFILDEKKNAIKVTVPGFRQDVKAEVDLAEEIARIYGYENISLTIPRIVGNTGIKEFIDIFEERIGEILTRLGMSEVITYSLVKRSGTENLGAGEDELIPIQNPLSIEQELLRPSMLPGMCGVISHNLKRYARRNSFFEIGKIYKNNKGVLEEKPVLSLGVAGLKREDWNTGKEGFDFFDMKGIFERLMDGLGLRGEIIFSKNDVPGLKNGQSATVSSGKEIIASLGEIDPGISAEYDIKGPLFYCEVYLHELGKKVRLEKSYVPYGKYPPISRDISILLDAGVTSHEVTNIIKEIGNPLARGVRLVSIYRAKEIPENKRALLYRIEYRSDDRTLEDAEVEKVHTDIRNTLSAKLNVSFR